MTIAHLIDDAWEALVNVVACYAKYRRAAHSRRASLRAALRANNPNVRTIDMRSQLEKK